MPQLRVALAQVNATVGALGANADTIVDRARAALERGAHLVLFPEMMLTGYPPEDLVLRRSFVEASRSGVEALAIRLADEGLGDIAVVVGYCDRSPARPGRPGQPASRRTPPRCSTAGVVARYAKHHLPNYGVFDEFRYFVPGDTLPVVRLHGVDVAIAICEDLWQEGGPIAVARAAEAGLVLCINGSPYERNKDDVRLNLNVKRAAEAGRRARLRQPGRRPGRAGLRRRLAGRGCRRRVARPRPTVRGGPADRRPRPAGRRGPAGRRRRSRRHPDARRTAKCRRGAGAIRRPPDASPDRCSRSTDEAEVWGALVTGTRDYVEKNGFSRW